jgi:predicted type IV restriction endonuclease
MTDLVETLRRCEKWLDRYRDQGRSVGEQNTKAGLIEPILEALGWDVRDPDEVHREYRRLPGDNPVDYALLLLRTPRLFVEAKGIGENLNDSKWANQIIAYATAAGVEWVALTNGAEWRIYNAHAPVPIEKKLFRTVRIDGDLDETLRVLRLLSKDNTGENRIEELWKAYFVDRQVRDVLVDLFSGGEPAKELVAAVHHRAPSLSLHDIRISIARARAVFEFPAVSDGPADREKSTLLDAGSTPRTPVPKSEEPSERPRSKRISPGERSLSLIDLLGRRGLAAGATLEMTYFGESNTAEMLADGRISYRGTVYETLSAAGEAVKVAVRGNDLPKSVLATDGWSSWRTVDGKTGELITIKELRRRASETSSD